MIKYELLKKLRLQCRQAFKKGLCLVFTIELPLDICLIVIGGGVVSLSYALEVAKHGTVVVITKAPLESNKNYTYRCASVVPFRLNRSYVQDTITAGALFM